MVKTTDLHILRFKPDLTLEDGHAPPAGFDKAMAELKAVPGVESVYLGPRVEEPAGTWMVAATWESAGAADAFYMSERWTPWRAEVRAFVEHVDKGGWESRRVVMKDGDGDADDGEDAKGLSALQSNDAVAVALGAPCTEVFTGYGAETDFEHQVLRFARAVTAAAAADGVVAGFRGAVSGKAKGRVTREGREVGGETVVLIMGWDSRDAHMEAKESSVIQDNMHELRSGRKEVEMFHAKLRRL